jgi:hypothetical protein
VFREDTRDVGPAELALTHALGPFTIPSQNVLWLLASAIAIQEQAHAQDANFLTLQSSDAISEHWLASLYPVPAEASAPDTPIAPSQLEGQVPQSSSRSGSL